MGVLCGGMATEPRERLQREKETVRGLVDDGVISTETKDRLLEYADALDESKARHTLKTENGNRRTLSPRSVEGYIQSLRICAQESLDLLDTTAAEINNLIHRMHDEGGKSKITLMRYQIAAQAFYRYHDDLDTDPSEIEKYSERSSPKHDELDMFTGDDIQALRDACGKTKMPVRNRAFLELLIYTGQRLSALLTLRIKDADMNGDQGYIYLNEDYDKEHGGLKNALQRGRKRPVFGAQKYVRDWIEYHPRGDDPDAWLFVGDPNHWKTDLDSHWSRPSADQRLRQIADEADVDKPPNAHNFRHYCATVLYRDYDLRKDEIRMLLGHKQDSKTLEEIYSHVFDEDYIRKMEEKTGHREKEERNPLTPETCPTCGELLADDAKACANCGQLLTPDAESAKDDLQQDIGAERALSDDEISDNELQAIADDDALLAKLIEMRSDE